MWFTRWKKQKKKQQKTRERHPAALVTVATPPPPSLFSIVIIHSSRQEMTPTDVQFFKVKASRSVVRSKSWGLQKKHIQKNPEILTVQTQNSCFEKHHLSIKQSNRWLTLPEPAAAAPVKDMFPPTEPGTTLQGTKRFLQPVFVSTEVWRFSICAHDFTTVMTIYGQASSSVWSVTSCLRVEAQRTKTKLVCGFRFFNFFKNSESCNPRAGKFFWA